MAQAIINEEGLKELAKKMKNFNIEVNEHPIINKYVFIVWDRIGDGERAICAETLDEAKHDLEEEIAESTYYTGKVGYRLKTIIRGK